MQKELKFYSIEYGEKEYRNGCIVTLKHIYSRKSIRFVVGILDGQILSFELEKIHKPTPLTHDLIASILELQNLSISSAVIHDIRDGFFYTRLHFSNGKYVACRPSDALILTMKLNAPFYIDEDIFNAYSTDLPLEENDTPVAEITEETPQAQDEIQLLQLKLDEAVKNEDFEKAANFRDQLKKINENN